MIYFCDIYDKITGFIGLIGLCVFVFAFAAQSRRGENTDRDRWANKIALWGLSIIVFLSLIVVLMPSKQFLCGA